MKSSVILIASALAVAGCGLFPGAEKKSAPPEPAAETAVMPSDTPPPPATARTPEQFDTTSDAERAKAVEAAQSQDAARKLGSTIASLGAVGEPGIWMKTPLVSKPRKGRVNYPAKGTSVAVDLLPLEGDAGAGSQLSLAAMRLLEADLTGLPEVEVFATGD